MVEYTCIVCPNSCRITVEEKDGKLDILGAACKRGEEFAQKEYTDPVRMFTSTVRLKGSLMRRLPVITTGEVRKDSIPDCQKAVNLLDVTAPVRCGDVIVEDFCHQGVSLVAAKSAE